MIGRRAFLFGAAAMAAPAIIRPGILMPVKPYFITDPSHTHSIISGEGGVAINVMEQVAPSLNERSLLALLRMVRDTHINHPRFFVVPPR